MGNYTDNTQKKDQNRKKPTLLMSSKVRLWLFRLAQACASAINSAT